MKDLSCRITAGGNYRPETLLIYEACVAHILAVDQSYELDFLREDLPELFSEGNIR